MKFIVFFSIKKKIIPGVIVNIIALIVELILINTWGNFVFDFNHFPEWASQSPALSNATFSSNF